MVDKNIQCWIFYTNMTLRKVPRLHAQSYDLLELFSLVLKNLIFGENEQVSCDNWKVSKTT